MLARLIASLRGLTGRRRIEGEVDEELRDHLEREVEIHRAHGLSPSEARRRALRDLGGLTQARDAVRDVRATWLDIFWRDVRHAVRMLRRTPRFTMTALILVVLGVGATTAIFSISHAVLLRDRSRRATAIPSVAPRADRGAQPPGLSIWPGPVRRLSPVRAPSARPESRTIR